MADLHTTLRTTTISVVKKDEDDGAADSERDASSKYFSNSGPNSNDSPVLQHPDAVSASRGHLQNPLQVKPLGQCQEHLETIISWCEESWGYLRPNQPDYTRQLFVQRLSSDRLPIAYVSFDKSNQTVPIGTFSLTPNITGVGDPNWIMLNNLYVVKDHRGRGIAKELIRIAEAMARDVFKVDTLQLGIVQLSLKSFYEKLGWTLVEETSLGPHKALIFAKKLDQPHSKM